MQITSAAHIDKQSWMQFVDGENLTFRAQAFAGENRFQLREGEHYCRDCYVWLPSTHGRRRFAHFNPPLRDYALRSSYYTSLVGDDQHITDVRERLWKLGFSPQVFKKTRQDQKAKGVDIALTKDMLAHAFLGNYDVAVLIAGDGDYVPLVEEVKRLGKVVLLAFFADGGLSPDLRRACDDFFDITGTFVYEWRPQ